MPGLGAQAPQGVADAYQTLVNQPLTVSPNGVLGNDIDLNFDPLTAALVSNVSHGVLSLQADGSFTYTPSAGYAGLDSFTYRASDGGLESPATTVTIHVGDPR